MKDSRVPTVVWGGAGVREESQEPEQGQGSYTTTPTTTNGHWIVSFDWSDEKVRRSFLRVSCRVGRRAFYRPPGEQLGAHHTTRAVNLVSCREITVNKVLVFVH